MRCKKTASTKKQIRYIIPFMNYALYWNLLVPLEPTLNWHVKRWLELLQMIHEIYIYIYFKCDTTIVL